MDLHFNAGWPLSTGQVSDLVLSHSCKKNVSDLLAVALQDKC